MSLKDRINDELKVAMRAGDAARRDAIRLLTAEMKRKEVDERVEIDDTHITAIVDKMIKQRKDSIAQFEAGGRQDLADKERFELDVLMAYMPAQMSADEVAAEIASVVASLGAAGPQDMGKVMSLLKTRLAGRADMTTVSAQVKAALAK